MSGAAQHGTGAAGGAYGGQGQHGAGAAGPAATASTAPPPSTQNLNQIVTDYLLKRGFTQTEEIFRKESANLGPDGRPVHTKVEEMGARKFSEAFANLRDFIENGVDVYKFELRKLLWPIFVYSYLELVDRRYPDDAKAFLNKFRQEFENVHGDDLKTFSTIALPQHIIENATTKLYRENKYRIPLNSTVERSLFHFLDRDSERGGSIIAWLLSQFCEINTTARGPIDQYSFEAIYRRSQNLELDEVDHQEGIPGVFTGITNKDVLDGPLKLGPLPMDSDLRDDVRLELEEEDQRNPPTDGRPTLLDEFERKIKREEDADGPTRAELPLPPSRARDVVIEMQKVRENRDRFKIEGRTGGVGIPISVCMFTFHNTLGSVSCMDFSKDHELVAVGTMDSYIRVWSLDGKPLKSRLAPDKDLRVNNRKLIGHSGPVYGIHFSDAISSSNLTPSGDEKPADTTSNTLLSCSADGQIRLWSLDTWSCLCIYKAHDGPVLRVLWGPHGHYFASAGWDKTVRIFMQDHASAQRICVGHDTSISALAWHPNGTYVFSASDETDKSIRMWSVSTGQCVRVLTGHTDYISALECAPNGKILASADIGGNIFFWDISKGSRIKRCRGHGKGGIPSLSFSVESNVLVSGGVDGTVRVWDVELPADGNKSSLGAPVTATPAQPENGAAAGDTVTVGGGQADRSITVGGQTSQPSTSGATASGTAGTGKKKGKEVMITPDQISAFPTKKTPVLKVNFTRMNLVVAGGCYDPER